MRRDKFWGLLLLISLVLQVRGDLNLDVCDSIVKVVPGNVFRLIIPERVSWRYPRWVSYRWCAFSESGIRFRCENNYDYTEALKNRHCDYIFNIYVNATASPYSYCGGNFSIDSYDKDYLVMTLDAPLAPHIKCYIEPLMKFESAEKNNDKTLDKVKIVEQNNVKTLDNVKIVEKNNDETLNKVEAAEKNNVEVPEKNKSCNCNLKKTNSTKASLTKKVVGGKSTTTLEYPFTAAIVQSDIKQLICGGTIISSRHVLTAAHCFVNPESSKFEVLVGAHDISKIDRNNSMLYQIERRHIHPNFTNSSLSPYDIAIITVVGEIKFTDEVGPACLPIDRYYDKFLDGSFLQVLGWGLTSFGGELPKSLQVARVVGLNLLTCEKDIPQIELHQLCTYADSQDACQFDSGGPVLWENPLTEDVMVVGIISYGKGCANFEPSVNTRVSSFIDWIEEVTSGEKFCQAESVIFDELGS